MRSCKRHEYPVHRLLLERPNCKREAGAPQPKIRTPKDAADLVREHYSRMPQEAALAILVNSSNEVLGVVELSVGGLGSTQVDPRVAFGAAIAAGAPAMIFAHNHPSGSLEPSPADMQLTRRLKDGAKLLDIALLDHIIVTERGYYSFVEGDTF